MFLNVDSIRGEKKKLFNLMEKNFTKPKNSQKIKKIPKSSQKFERSSSKKSSRNFPPDGADPSASASASEICTATRHTSTMNQHVTANVPPRPVPAIKLSSRIKIASADVPPIPSLNAPPTNFSIPPRATVNVK